MHYSRSVLEAEFLELCRLRGPAWIESVIRPLRLPGKVITVRDIPLPVLSSITSLFGGVRRPASGLTAV